jgi:hypothetical protein
MKMRLNENAIKIAGEMLETKLCKLMCTLKACHSNHNVEAHVNGKPSQFEIHI